MKTLSDDLQKYVDLLASAGRPLGFPEITAETPGRNHFRHLLKRELVHDVTTYYKPGEEYDGARCPRYVLTPKGWGYVDVVKLLRDQ